ncbi:MAG: type II toxin-antitoxin system VapC family toxin [Candidatus Dormibacteria bacterium]
MLDASITLAWCFEDQATPLSRAVLEQLAYGRGLVPEIWPFEVASVLAVATRRGRITPAQAVRFLQVLDRLPITVEALGREQVFTTVLTLSEPTGLTLYDASYLALAAYAGVPLATSDERLRKAGIAVGVALFQPEGNPAADPVLDDRRERSGGAHQP